MIVFNLMSGILIICRYDLKFALVNSKLYMDLFLESILVYLTFTPCWHFPSDSIPQSDLEPGVP